MKQLIRQIFRRFNIDIGDARFRRSINDFLTDRQISLVLDVGANEGYFAQSIREKGYKGTIHSFEPVSSVFQKLQDASRADPQWLAYNFGLGAKSETTEINISDASVFSSLLPITEAARGFSERATSTHTETIEVRTLDEVLPSPPDNTLLKIDTQGFERQVLEGARTVLPAIKGVLMELPIIQLYQGNWQFHEAVEYMADADFVPAQIHPVNFHPQDNVSLVEVDCLFRRRDPARDGAATRAR